MREQSVMSQKSCFYGVLFALTGLLLLVSGTAQAADGRYNNCSSPQLPASTTIQAKSWSALPIGSPIPGADVNTTIQITCAAASDADTAGCIGGGGWALTANSFTPGETSLTNTYTYPGLNAGVGFQALGEDGLPLPMQYGQQNARFFILNPERPVDGPQTAHIRFRLVKTAATVTEGTSPIPRFYMACNGSEYANVNEALSYVNLSANITRVTSSCVPVVSETTVTLPSVGRTSFQGVGDTAKRTSFNLGFQCDADAHALVAFTDGSTPGTTGTVVKLNTGSTATGVGVQLLSDGVPVEMTPNELMSVGGTHLKLDSEPGASQVVNLPLSVEYVQTATEITSGTVNASVLVNIAYQ